MPRPEPMLFPIDFHACFIRANNTAVQNAMSDQFIGISTFGCQPVKQVMQPALTYGCAQKVVQHLLKSFKRQILSAIEVSNKRFNVASIADRAIYHNRKRTFYNLPTCILTPINLMFGNNLFNRWNVDYLSFAKKLKGVVVQVFTAFRTKTCTVFNNLIRSLGHFQCFSSMPGLATYFTVALLSKAAGAWRSILVPRRWDRTVITVFPHLVFLQFQLQFADFFLQHNNFLRLFFHQMNQFVHCYLIRHLQVLYRKSKSEIHYIKERNCLFINSYKQFMLTVFVFQTK